MLQVLALLEALSGQHRRNMFGGFINDVNLPTSVWKITVGEMLFPNIWKEMPMRAEKWRERALTREILLELF